MKSLRMALIVSIALLTASSCDRPQTNPNSEEALKELQDQVNDALPTIASLTGIQNTEPVKVALLTRAELGLYFERNLKIEYPDEELKKRGQCFALIGLLPEGYDMEAGFTTLLRQQAGAAYDLRSKTLIGLSDLPREETRSVNDRMVLSHELTHALQDRVIDLARESETALEDIDYEYAIRAILEGMASSVMIAYAQDLSLNRLPDMQKFWRTQLSQLPGGTFGGSPRYVSEYLMSPYAEGGAFMQAWQKENPDKALKEIFERIPASSEQVLHYEKYAGRDEPTRIDLSGVHGILPGDWKLSYTNTLGEFELLMLFRIHDVTKDSAGVLAGGWDGCRFEEYRDKDGNAILVGTSIWDRQTDAEEFCEGFGRVLETYRTSRAYEILQSKARASFVIGLADRDLRRKILKRCDATR